MAKPEAYYAYRGKNVRVVKGAENVPEWLHRMAKEESRTVSGCINHIMRLYFLKGDGRCYLSKEELAGESPKL